MFILKFIDDEDNLAVKEFISLTELKRYVSQNNLERAWHQVEEVKKVIPNLIQD